MVLYFWLSWQNTKAKAVSHRIWNISNIFTVPLHRTLVELSSSSSALRPTSVTKPSTPRNYAFHSIVVRCEPVLLSNLQPGRHWWHYWVAWKGLAVDEKFLSPYTGSLHWLGSGVHYEIYLTICFVCKWRKTLVDGTFRLSSHFCVCNWSPENVCAQIRRRACYKPKYVVFLSRQRRCLWKDIPLLDRKCKRALLIVTFSN